MVFAKLTWHQTMAMRGVASILLYDSRADLSVPDHGKGALRCFRVSSTAQGHVHGYTSLFDEVARGDMALWQSGLCNM
jgi:hypothetical protein